MAPNLNKPEFTSKKKICSKFRVNWRSNSGEEDFLMSSMYFHYVVITLHFNTFEFLLPKNTLLIGWLKLDKELWRLTVYCFTPYKQYLSHIMLVVLENETKMWKVYVDLEKNTKVGNLWVLGISLLKGWKGRWCYSKWQILITCRHLYLKKLKYHFSVFVSLHYLVTPFLVTRQ